MSLAFFLFHRFDEKKYQMTKLEKSKSDTRNKVYLRFILKEVYMDFAVELKNHLIEEEKVLDSIIASQKQVRFFVTKRDWMSLENEMKLLQDKANIFMTLEDERNQLIEKTSLEIGEEKVKQICKSENLLKEVKRKLVFSKIENDSLNTYIEITKNFLQGIFETVVPTRRNTLYSRTGNIVRPVPESLLVNTLG